MADLNQTIYNIEVGKQEKKAKEVFESLMLGGSSVSAYQHIITVLSFLFKKNAFTTEALKKIICDSEKDEQIDAIYVNGNDVFVFDVKGSPGFKDKDIQPFLSSVKNNIFEKNFSKNLHPHSKALINKIRRIKNRSITIVIFRNTQAAPPPYSVEDFKTYKSFNKVTFLNVDNVVNGYVDEAGEFPPLKLPVDPRLVIEDCAPEKSELLIKLKAGLIIKHKDIGENKGYDFFYKNVREPKMEMGFGRELERTIAKYKDKFHLLHNGITLTSSEITRDGGYYVIKNPQVINGAQTIAWLHRLYKDDKHNLNSVDIFCKILKADKEFSQKVCETANTQNPVYIWQLRAHDTLHVKIERFVNKSNLGVFYSRKNRVGSKKGDFILKIDLFVQWVYSACFKKPWQVKTSKKSLFNDPTESTSIYSEIEKYLSTISTESIRQLLKTAVAVERFISHAPKDEKGFLRDIRFYIIAFAFQKKSCDVEKYKELSAFLYKYSDKQKKKTKANLTNNKIFNQSGSTVWKIIEKKYAI